MSTPPDSLEELLNYHNLQNARVLALEKERGSELSEEELHRVWFDAELVALKDSLRNGVVPSPLIQSMPFLHAQSFVSALWALRLAIWKFHKIAESMIVEVASKTALEMFDKNLPDLKRVRDSVAHVDERVIGKAKGKNIRAENGFEGALLLNIIGNVFLAVGLINDNLCSTAEGNKQAYVSVNAVTLTLAADCFQNFVNELKWDGSPKLAPTR